jgi:alpha-1,4-digalacturonate transport system substrate-binding protein
MKSRLAIAVGAAAAMSLSACGFGGSGGDDDTLRFWLSGDANQGGGFQAMADKYEAETGIKVEIDDVPYDDFQTRLRNAAQANGLPDLARVSSVDTLWMNQLQDLSGIAADHGVMANLLVENEDGAVPAIPTDLTAVGLFINKSLFDEAGVAYPTAPDEIWTWDEFIEALREVKDGTGARYGLVMDGSSHRLRSFMYQFGSDGFTRDGCSYTTSPATAEALRLFADINDDDIMPRSVWVSGDDPNALFKSGQVAAYYSGSWQVTDFSQNITDFEWASVYMPAQTRRATNVGGGLMVAFDGPKAEMARDFIDWLYTPANYKELSETSGFLPVIGGLDIAYAESPESFELYNEEIAASDPISGHQISNQLEMLYAGESVTSEGDPIRDEAIKLANDEQDVDATIQNIIGLLDEQLTGCE